MVKGYTAADVLIVAVAALAVALVVAAVFLLAV